MSKNKVFSLAGTFPRPDFRRENWFDLNGKWEFDFDDKNVGKKTVGMKGMNMPLLSVSHFAISPN